MDYTKASLEVLHILRKKSYRNISHSQASTQHRGIEIPLITPENVFEPQNMIFYIIMKKEKLGNVIFVTSNVESTLQYTPQELIDKNINTIMPEFYGEKHNKILTAHVEKSRNSIINRNRGVYAKKKNGYIIPTTLFVSIFPYFQKQLIYIGILRPIHTFDEFLLVLPNGVIDAFSENLREGS